jgi:hypothetical protein
MTKFIALGEDWRKLITEKNIHMILMTSVPETDVLMDKMVEYLNQNHPALFIHSYYYNENLVLGILKPVPEDLKELIEPDTLVAKANDQVLEIQTNDIVHITIVRESEKDELFDCLKQFMHLKPKNNPFNKKNNDNRD